MKFDYLDEILSTPKSDNAEQTMIDIDKLVPYHNHQFKLYTGERFNDMVQSIKKNGILIPIIALAIDENTAARFTDKSEKNFYKENIGKYEILSGHNRVNAALTAGNYNVPAIVKTGLSKSDVENYVYETNLIQRGFKDLSISEQAAVVAHRHSTMFSKSKAEEIQEELVNLENGCAGEKNTENAVYIKNKGRKDKLIAVGTEYGLSRNSISRLLHIDTLTDDLKRSIDLNLISIRAGVELSFIPEAAQRAIFDFYRKTYTSNEVEYEAAEISLKDAVGLRSTLSDYDGNVQTAVKMIEVYKKTLSDSEEKPKKRKINTEIYSKYFSEEETDEYVSCIIDEALQMYFEREREETG